MRGLNYKPTSRKVLEFIGIYCVASVALFLSLLLFCLCVYVGQKTFFKTSTSAFVDNSDTVYANLEDELIKLGATDIEMDVDKGGNHIYFKIGGIEASLTKVALADDHYVVGDTALTFFIYDDHYLDEMEKSTLESDEIEAFSYRPIDSFYEGNDRDATIKYYDSKREMYLTDTMVRCIDYAGMVGEFYQRNDGSYHAVYDDIFIWLNGDEPEDYDYDVVYN